MSYEREEATPRSLVLCFGVLACFVFLWPAVLTFDVGDWPSASQFPYNSPAANACGAVGAWLAYYLRYFLGSGVYPLLLFGTLAALFRLIHGYVDHLVERGLGVLLLIACTAAATHLIPGSSSLAPLPGQGGLVGAALGEWLRHSADTLGTIIVLLASFFVGLLFATEGWILRVPSAISHVVRSSAMPGLWWQRCLGFLSSFRFVPVGSTVTAEESVALLDDPSPPPPRSKHSRKKSSEEEPTLFDEVASEEEPSAAAGDDDGESSEAAPRSRRAKKAASRRAQAIAKAKQAALVAAKKQVGPIVNFPSAEKLERAVAYPTQIENWTLPSRELLHEPDFGFNDEQEVIVREQARILEKTLEEFRVNAQVVEIDTGPVITMFELRVGPGIKVSQIGSLSNDIARALKAHAIRVVAPISGKNTVGIEVPNIKSERVRLKELMTVGGARASRMALPLFLGKDAGGQALMYDLTKMPHMLIAGTTGSGKSVCLNAIILSLLMTKRPDHVKMILIDPKMVEMTQFKDMPHLMCPIITDMQKAEKILEWAVTKMEERYELLAEARVKNIASYNALGPEALYARLTPKTKEEKAAILTFMPYMVIIIDELADLMMTAGKEVEHYLSRLAQKSRAVGVHIIVATQRPEVKVVTGLIKSNLPSRICFRVSSRMDSRIVLDQNGGEVLLGQGDMLVLPPGGHKLLRAQGTLLEDDEVQAVLEDLTSRSKPEFHPELMRIKTPGADGDLNVRDPLFNDAVRVVLESRRGSVSLLQRRLTIGYSRASRLVEQMSDAGIVGDYKGSQAREVLLTSDEWELLQAQVKRDMDDGYAADAEDFGESSDALAVPDVAETDDDVWDDEDTEVGEATDAYLEEAGEQDKEEDEDGEEEQEYAEDEYEEYEEGEEEEEDEDEEERA